MATAIRILIADDHDLLRSELRGDLEREGGFQVVAEAADGGGAVEAAVRERPDLCLLDVQMPCGGGIGAAAAIVTHVPETKVVMLTSSRNDADALAAARAGAVGYVLKDADARLLADVLRDVVDGGLRFPRSSAARLAAHLRVLGRGGDASVREHVLRLMEEGVAAREMPGRLALSPAVVREQLAALASELRALPAR